MEIENIPIKYKKGMNPNSRNGFKKGHKPFVDWNGRKHKPESRLKQRLAKLGKPSKKLNKGKGWIGSTGYKTKQLNKKPILEHHLIWLKYNKKSKIPEGYVIHHIDRNKQNNSIENLQLMTKSKHTKLHNEFRKIKN